MTVGTTKEKLSLQRRSEANNFNLALNRKICVDSNGRIKNYIGHERIFGNIEINSLRSIVELEDFQYIWNVNNDMIEVCKDCQFRYICPDNSNILIKDNKFYKLQTCNFNPYKNKWLKK